MNDFCTQEFLERNIRIRPVSGDSKSYVDDGKTTTIIDQVKSTDQVDKMDNLD